MKRDPVLEEKRKYTKSIRIKPFRPFFWRKCDCCGQEYKYERMICADMPTILCIHSRYVNIERTKYRHGCTDCFKTNDEFKKWLIEEGEIIEELLV